MTSLTGVKIFTADPHDRSADAENITERPFREALKKPKKTKETWICCKNPKKNLQKTYKTPFSEAKGIPNHPKKHTHGVMHLFSRQ